MEEKPEPVSVYVEPLGEGYVIDLAVQASVVRSLDTLAKIRFIDNRAEAIDAGEPDRPIKNGGLLIALGPIVTETETEHTVQVRRYSSDERYENLLATVTASGDLWKVQLDQAP